MKLGSLCLLLAVTVSLALAIPALATTYDVNTDWHAGSASSGAWKYGWTSNNATTGYFNPANYAFNLDGVSKSAMTNGAGSLWAETSTGGTWSSSNPVAFISQTTGANNWKYQDIPYPSIFVAPDANAPAQNGTAVGAAVVLSFAPGAGTYNYTGSLTNINDNYGLVDRIILRGADGSFTTLHDISTASIGNASYTPANLKYGLSGYTGSGTWLTNTYYWDNFSGAVTLAAGDSLDFVFSQSSNALSQRVIGKLNLTITSSDVPEPGSLVALAAGLFSLGGLALRRMK